MEIIIRDLENFDRNSLEQIYDQYWAGSFREKLTRKIDEFVFRSEKSKVEDVHYYVAVLNEEIIGAISWRICPGPMRTYTTTNNPIEIYILAVKNKGNGVGRRLIERTILDAKNQGYTEAVLYNSDSHKESRGFYKNVGFHSSGVALAPDGEAGEAFTLVF